VATDPKTGHIVTTTAYPSGQKEVNIDDADGNFVSGSIFYPNGDTSYTVPNGTGFIVKRKTGDGGNGYRVTQSKVDDAGTVVSEDVLETLKITHEADKAFETWEDLIGKKIRTREFDASNALIKTTTIQINPDGSKNTTVNENGAVTEIFDSADGKTREVTGPDGVKTTTEKNDDGSLIKTIVENPDGSSTITEPKAAGGEIISRIVPENAHKSVTTVSETDGPSGPETLIRVITTTIDPDNKRMMIDTDDKIKKETHHATKDTETNQIIKQMTTQENGEQKGRSDTATGGYIEFVKAIDKSGSGFETTTTEYDARGKYISIEKEYANRNHSVQKPSEDGGCTVRYKRYKTNGYTITLGRYDAANKQIDQKIIEEQRRFETEGGGEALETKSEDHIRTVYFATDKSTLLRTEFVETDSRGVVTTTFRVTFEDPLRTDLPVGLTKNIKYPNGIEQTTSPDGTVITIEPDSHGKFKTTVAHPGGSHTVTDVDGTITNYNPGDAVPNFPPVFLPVDGGGGGSVVVGGGGGGGSVVVSGGGGGGSVVVSGGGGDGSVVVGGGGGGGGGSVVVVGGGGDVVGGSSSSHGGTPPRSRSGSFVSVEGGDGGSDGGGDGVVSAGGGDGVVSAGGGDGVVSAGGVVGIVGDSGGGGGGTTIDVTKFGRVVPWSELEHEDFEHREEGRFYNEAHILVTDPEELVIYERPHFFYTDFDNQNGHLIRDARGQYLTEPTPFTALDEANACLKYLVSVYNTDMSFACEYGDYTLVAAFNLRQLAVMNIVALLKQREELDALKASASARASCGGASAPTSAEIQALEARVAEVVVQRNYWFEEHKKLAEEKPFLDQEIVNLKAEKSQLEIDLATETGRAATLKTTLEAKIVVLENEKNVLTLDKVKAEKDYTDLKVKYEAMVATLTAPPAAGASRTFTAAQFKTISDMHDHEKARADKAAVDKVEADKRALESDRLKGIAEKDLAASQAECTKAQDACTKLNGELAKAAKARLGLVAAQKKTMESAKRLDAQNKALRTHQSQLTAWGTQMQDIARAAFPYMQKTVEFYGADYALVPARMTLKDKGVGDPPAPP
jgi:hypothetical protein